MYIKLDIELGSDALCVEVQDPVSVYFSVWGEAISAQKTTRACTIQFAVSVFGLY